MKWLSMESLSSEQAIFETIRLQVQYWWSNHLEKYLISYLWAESVAIQMNHFLDTKLNLKL